jgi:predicted Zn-dependent protease with MMP-like domain
VRTSTYETLTEIEWDRVNRVWNALDEGETERARIEVDDLLRSRPGHPDLRIVSAAVALDEGEPKKALEALAGAERSADPALFFHLRAVAAFDLSRFDAARDDAQRAVDVHPDLAEAHDLLSRVYEHLGDAEHSAEHAEAAAEIDPESFPGPLDVTDDDFDHIVEQAILELPEKVRHHLEELPIVVEPLPRPEMLTGDDPPLPPDLLGLFVGRHLLERGHDDVPGAPGAIYLFRRNLLRFCHDLDELKKEIRVTVQHEVGHLLGLDEDDLESWGLA